MFNKGQLAGLMKQAQAMQDNEKKPPGRVGPYRSEWRIGLRSGESHYDLQA